MARRKKVVYTGNPWPPHWVVSPTWTVPAETKLPRGSVRELVSRQHEVALKGHPSIWYTFDRHVSNPEKGVDWIDSFATPPHAHFHSFRPDQIINTRRHLVRKKKVADNAS